MASVIQRFEPLYVKVVLAATSGVSGRTVIAPLVVDDDVYRTIVFWWFRLVPWQPVPYLQPWRDFESGAAWRAFQRRTVLGKLTQLKAIAFDKTGTLTKGRQL